jgi:hypothetical protein
MDVRYLEARKTRNGSTYPHSQTITAKNDKNDKNDKN